MYWIFLTDLIEWKNGLIIGKIINNPRKPLQKPDWWSQDIISDPRPAFKFSINPEAPSVDNYPTGTIYDLYSKKLLSILAEEKIAFETFTTNLFDVKTGNQLETSHWVFRLLEMHDALDKKRTTFESKLVRGIRGDWIRKLVLDHDFQKRKIQMTRIETKKDIVIIHDDLKNKLERNNISGCKYQPVDEYISPKLKTLTDLYP